MVLTENTNLVTSPDAKLHLVSFFLNLKLDPALQPWIPIYTCMKILIPAIHFLLVRLLARTQ